MIKKIGACHLNYRHLLGPFDHLQWYKNMNKLDLVLAHVSVCGPLRVIGASDPVYKNVYAGATHLFTICIVL